MSLKQSCFNTLVKSNIKRNLWLSLIFAFTLILTTALPIYYGIMDTLNYGYSFDEERLVLQGFYSAVPVALIFGALISCFLFRYNDTVSSVTFAHSLPVTRTKWYVSNVVSGLTMILIPILLNIVICLGTLGYGVKLWWLVSNSLVIVLYGLVAFSIATFVGMLTGVSAAKPVFALILALLPLYIGGFIETLSESYLYGYTGGKLVFLFDWIYLGFNVLKTAKCLVYVALVIIFLVSSLFIYKARHLEHHGDVVAFPSLVGIFKVAFGFCFGIGGYFYMNAFWDNSSIWAMPVFCLVGVMIAHLIAHKNFKIVPILKAFAITLVMVAALYLVFFSDVFGFENRVPDISKIESVTDERLDNGGRYYYSDKLEAEYAIRESSGSPVFTSEEHIKMFVELHKAKLQNRTNFRRNSPNIDNGVTISYKLKNGTTLKRTYYLTDEEMVRYLKPIYETKEYREYKYPVLGDEITNYSLVAISDVRSKNESSLITFAGNSEQAKRIIEAVKKDRETISYERQLANELSNNFVSIHLTGDASAVTDSGKEVTVDVTDIYVVNEHDVNTYAVLSELGVFDKEIIYTVDDVYAVEVTHDAVYEKYYSDTEEERVIYDYDYKYVGEYKRIIDREQIKQVYDFVSKGVKEVSPTEEKLCVFNIRFVTHDDREIYISAQCGKDLLPDVLKDLVK